MLRVISLLGFICMGGAAAAFERVAERSEFMELLSGRELYLGLLNAQLSVNSDGTITGSARNTPVTGRWSWQDGFFCREMDWSGREIAYDCQLVEQDAGRMRFSSERGAGRRAVFQLR